MEEGVERLASVESIQDGSTCDQNAARVLAGNISDVIPSYSSRDLARISKDVKEQSEVERACSQSNESIAPGHFGCVHVLDMILI